ncbi:MAG TPA: ABC transporter permease [Thermoanaerobaculia bacterium]|jgi:simple sugar transport system permease protein|nr:ABC transporter permease [Thermoanaerobaculia bacterium]
MKELLQIGLIMSAIRLATPLLLAALGGLLSERSGVINIALEGLMLAGSFTAAVVTHFSGNPWLGLLAGIFAGAAVAYLHAVACIRYGADQVVSGTAINILFLGVPALLSGAMFASTGATPQIPQANLLPVAPIVLAFALVPILTLVLARTRFGLRLRAVGENPAAADAAGVSVVRIRTLAVVLSGALAAIGGAYLSIGQSSLFTRNMTAGRGFIALAALIMGKWKPVPTMFACLLFGLAEAISIQMQGVTAIPVQFIQIIPYVLTLVVLAGFIGRSRPPKALGVPYQKER